MIAWLSQMVVEVAKRITARQGNLRAAFGLLDIKHQEWIDGATMIALFLAIGRYRCVFLLHRFVIHFAFVTSHLVLKFLLYQT